MTMTHDQFSQLVARLETQARDNPERYKRHVVLLAFAGYAYLALVLGLLVALLAAAVWSMAYLKGLAIKIVIGLGILIWVVVRSLWIKFMPPDGIEVRREDAPALFAMIDDLRAKLDSQRFDHVLVSNEFNASVVQLPRLGPLGWHRNYLVIGLPLMRFLTPHQLEAVLAHEFGHLAGGHGRMSNWIYRLRLSFYRLLDVLEQQKSLGTFLFKPFFGVYAPYFNAYSFPLARANEYEADAAAARLVSPATAAQALTSVNVVGSYLGERYWSGVHKKADDVPEPSVTPFASMSGRLMSGVDGGDVASWLKVAMTRPTTVDDTHPALSDRLKAIGEEPRLSLPPPGEAADTLLGGSLQRIAERFDQEWKQAIAPMWEERYREVQRGRSRLAELDALAARPEELAIDAAYERATLTETVGAAPDRAMEQLRKLHERAPEDTGVCFVLGQRLLAKDDEAGFKMIEKAMARDAMTALHAAEILRDYCWRKGRTEEANAWHARFVDSAQLIEEARKERDTIHSSDKFEVHGLPEEVIADLRRQIASTFPRVRKAYFVRKRLKTLPEQPLFVLGFIVTPPWRWRRQREQLDVQKQLVTTVKFPGETLVFSVEGDMYQFGRRFRYMRGSRIL